MLIYVLLIKYVSIGETDILSIQIEQSNVRNLSEIFVDECEDRGRSANNDKYGDHPPDGIGYGEFHNCQNGVEIRTNVGITTLLIYLLTPPLTSSGSFSILP
jgi:hypothetical protein